MEPILEKITEFLRQVLQGWVLTNLETMFTNLNTQTMGMAAIISLPPDGFNSEIFSFVRSLSDNVMVPVAGMIISAVLCYELVSMVMDRNNMHEIGSEFFFRYIIKACIAVMLLSKTADIVLGIFDLGQYVTMKAAAVTLGNSSIDATDAIVDIFVNSLDTMGIGDLFSLGIESAIVSLSMKIMAVLITVILYGRMVEIYLYISVAPVPFATLTNREWGSIGTNYIKGLFALAFQGFFIVVCMGIYAVLVSNIPLAADMHAAMWSTAIYVVVLCFSLFKTGSLTRAVFNAH